MKLTDDKVGHVLASVNTAQPLHSSVVSSHQYRGQSPLTSLFNSRVEVVNDLQEPMK